MIAIACITPMVLVVSAVLIIRQLPETSCEWLSDEETSQRSIGFDIDNNGWDNDVATVSCSSGSAGSRDLIEDGDNVDLADLMADATHSGWLVGSQRNGSSSSSFCLFREDPGWERTELKVVWSDVVRRAFLRVSNDTACSE